MLARLFQTEFERIAAVIESRCLRSADPAERLYLASATAAGYLLARPDVLVALDWVRTQRLGLGDLMPGRMDTAFSFLKDEAAAGKISLLPAGFKTTVRWILFLTVHQLVPYRKAEVREGQTNRKLRTLHAFILNGLGEV